MIQLQEIIQTIIALNINWEVLVALVALLFTMYQTNRSKHLDQQKAIAEATMTRKQEESELYQSYKSKLKIQLRKIIEVEHKQLYLNFKDQKGLLSLFKGNQHDVYINKKDVFDLLDLLSDIEFQYCKKQDSKYWKRFDHFFQYVFDKPYYKTAFFKFKEKHVVNVSFIEYVDKIITSEKQEEELVNNKEFNYEEINE